MVSRRTLARPRVECCSSRVAMYDGHIVPSSVLRHAPRPLHISMAPATPPFRVVEERDRISSRVAGAEAQVGREWRSVNDLAGIEDAVWIEGLLDRAERVVERRTEHLLHERAAHEAVAMLTGERSAELEHEIGDVVGDRLELAARRCRSSC